MSAELSASEYAAWEAAATAADPDCPKCGHFVSFHQPHCEATLGGWSDWTYCDCLLPD
jgi:hypothetical protein